jgi:phospholipid transport system substrate-binding protein
VATVAASPADEEGARATVQQVLDQALGVLRDPNLGQEEKRLGIEKIAEDSFNFPVITKLVLARNWKKLDERQREAFLLEFKRHLSTTYGRRINRFSEEEVTVGEAQTNSNGDITVYTKIVGGEADGVMLNYRMRQNDGNWYAIDVIIEGVSMISNFRSQIQEIVSSKGVDALIQTLHDKNANESLEEQS